MNVGHWWNDTDHRQAMYSERNLVSATVSITDRAFAGLGLNLGVCDDGPVTNWPSYGMA